MQCSSPADTSRTTPRSSPASRARRRLACILPAHLPSPRLRSPESRKSTLLPYYHPSPALDVLSIRPSSSPPVVPFLEPRLPPVDPRRSRRYCTDFGFTRTHPVDPLPRPPPMYHLDNSSSAGSTPQATYAETDSDASSFYHLDLEFPRPPVSPALRRMQSSPLFTPEETDAVREFLRKRWGTHVKARPPPTEPEPFADFSWETESPECGADTVSRDLELAGEELVQSTPAMRRESWLQMTPDLSVPSVAPLCPRRSHPPSVRLLRRATSMAAPPSPQVLGTPPPLPPPPMRALRFQDAPTATTPSLASAGRQKPHHRPNLSVPLMGLGLPDVAPLGPSFTHHRTARSQPVNIPCASGDPRSFIDLTPEKLAQRESTTRVHRERIKRLLSRASSGFIGWGKTLAGKRSHN